MIRFVVSTMVTAASALLFASCADSGTTAVATDGYPPNIHAIIYENCMNGNCHSSANSQNDSLDLSSWTGAIMTGDIAEIIPYRAINSHLFQHINTNALIDASAEPLMPPNGNGLPLSDQATIMNWLNNGAKDFFGNVPFTVIPHKLFVIHSEQDLVSVIDRDRERFARAEVVGNDILKSLPSLGPTGEVLSSDGSTLYIPFTSGLLRSFDAENYTKEQELSLAATPTSIALLPNMSKGYLSNAGTPDAHSFTVFDPKTLSLLRTVSSLQILMASQVVVSADGSRAYLICSGGDDIKIIDTKSDSIITRVAVASDVPIDLTPQYTSKYQPMQGVLSGDRSILYVTLYKAQQVVAIDLRTDSIVARIGVGYGPSGIAIAPDGSELWVTNQNSDGLSVISTAVNAVIATLDSVAQFPTDVAISRDGATVYVSSQILPGGGHHHSSGGGPPSGVFVIDRKSRKILNILEMPPLASSLLLN